MENLVPYANHRDAALALFLSGKQLSRKEGGFTGNIYADPKPLTEAQRVWLGALLRRAGLPPLAN